LELTEAIRGRRAFRAFLPDPIPEAHLEKILQACASTFSGANQPTWEIVVVRDRKLKEEIVKVSENQTFLAQAPVLLVMCGTRIFDILQVVSNAMLTAYSLGYGSCCVGSTDADKVEQILGVTKELKMLPEDIAEKLGIPEEMKVRILVPIGRPNPLHLPTNPGKRTIWEIANFDKWKNKRLTKAPEVVRALIDDSKTAIGDYDRGREGILKKEGMGDTLYRWEEKYAAFSFPNLTRRWVFYFTLLRDRKLVEVEQEFLERSMRTVGEYESQRWGHILRDHDVNSPAVVAHERKYSMEVFPKLINEWIEFAEKHLESISSVKTIGEYVDTSATERQYTA
jgi:nitroreductase